MGNSNTNASVASITSTASSAAERQDSESSDEPHNPAENILGKFMARAGVVDGVIQPDSENDGWDNCARTGDRDLDKLVAQMAEWDDDPERALQNIRKVTPLYKARWRQWPATRVSEFAYGMAVSAQLRYKLPAKEREDCELVNLLMDTWRERGWEVAGGPLVGCVLMLVV
jgi:hypothetical protein